MHERQGPYLKGVHMLLVGECNRALLDEACTTAVRGSESTGGNNVHHLHVAVALPTPGIYTFTDGPPVTLESATLTR